MSVWPAKASLFSVAVFASVVMAEVVIRFALPPPQIVVVERASDLQERTEPEGGRKILISIPEGPRAGRLVVDTETGRRLQANAVAVIHDHYLSKRRIEIRTNSLGYRNPEVGEKRGLRVLFLGDSITFGDFLPEEETFVRSVEHKARAQGGDWELINAALGSISLKTELAILEETGIGLQPDVVILGFYLNDFLDSPGVHIVRLPHWMQKSHLAHHAANATARLFQLWKGPSSARSAELDSLEIEEWRQEFLAGRARRRGDFKADRAAFDTVIARRFEDWGGAWSPRAWEYMEPLFHHLKALSLEHEFELFIVAFPVRRQVEASFLYDDPQQQLREFTGRGCRRGLRGKRLSGLSQRGPPARGVAILG